MNRSTNTTAAPDDGAIDQLLRDAGASMRAIAPDAEAAARAFERRHIAPVVDLSSRRRPWWPAGIGLGLTAALVIGVVAYNVGGDAVVVDTPATLPPVVASTAPATVPEGLPDEVTSGTAAFISTFTDTQPCSTLEIWPAVAPAPASVADVAVVDTTICASVTNDTAFGPLLVAGPEGWFLLDPATGADGGYGFDRFSVELLTADDDRTCGVPTSPDDAGRVVRIEGCNVSRLAKPAAVVHELPRQVEDMPGSWSVAPTDRFPTGVDLPEPLAVAGPDELASVMRVATVEIVGASCRIVLTGAEWYEACESAPPGEPLVLANSIIRVDGRLVQLGSGVDAAGQVLTATPIDGEPPLTSGCGRSELVELLDLIESEIAPAPVVTGAQCAGIVSASISSQLLQPATPDGALIEAQRPIDGGPLAIVDQGTDLGDDFSANPFPSAATWMEWPTSSDPSTAGDFGDLNVADPTLLDSWAAAIGETGSTRMLAVAPDGLPVAVFQIEVEQGDGSLLVETFATWFASDADGNLFPRITFGAT